jgi:hypothetical protein
MRPHGEAMTLALLARASEFSRAVARLIAFDGRRFRLPLAVLVGLELLRAAMGEWAIHGAALDRDTVTGMRASGFELQAIDGVLRIAAVVVIALLVQADHPADDRGFLRSRPVPPGTRAVATLALIAALASLIPFLITAARLVTYGAPVTAIGASAVQFVVIGGAFALPAWVLALGTRTLPRFLAVAAALVVVWTFLAAEVLSRGWYSWAGSGAAFRVRGAIAGFAPPLTDWQHADARGWLFALAMTIAASALLVGYYRNRRAIRWIAAGIVLIGAPALLPEPAGPVPEADLATIASGDVQLRDRLELAAMRAGERRIPLDSTVSVRVPLTLAAPLPATVSASLEAGRVRLRTADGGTIVGDASPCLDDGELTAWGLAGGRLPPAVLTVPGCVIVTQARGMSRRLRFRVGVPGDERLRGQTVGVDATARLDLTRHRVAASLALRAGASLRTASYLAEVRDVADDAHAVTIRFTRFPALGASSRQPLHLFQRYRGGDAQPVGGSLDASQTPRIAWAHGRTWSRQQTITLPNFGPGSGRRERPDRLVLVDAEPAGTLYLPVVGRRLPVVEVDMSQYTDRGY